MKVAALQRRTWINQSSSRPKTGKVCRESVVACLRTSCTFTLIHVRRGDIDCITRCNKYDQDFNLACKLPTPLSHLRLDRMGIPYIMSAVLPSQAECGSAPSNLSSSISTLRMGCNSNCRLSSRLFSRSATAPVSSPYYPHERTHVTRNKRLDSNTRVPRGDLPIAFNP